MANETYVIDYSGTQVDEGLSITTNSVAELWLSSKSYAPEDVVVFSGKIYLCVIASAPGTIPQGSSHWRETTIIERINETRNVGDMRKAEYDANNNGIVDISQSALSLQGTSLEELQLKLKSGTNIKTINENSILGSGNLQITAEWRTITGELSDNTKLNTALNSKVDKISGKGLSTNDYTTNEKTKLTGIEAGAQKNVIPDWDVTDSSNPAYIRGINTTTGPKQKIANIETNISNINENIQSMQSSLVAVNTKISAVENDLSNKQTIPTATGKSGVVEYALENNKEYTITNATYLRLTYPSVAQLPFTCHGFISFGNLTSAPVLVGFKRVDGDDITEAVSGETWEFSCFNGYCIFKDWR